MRPLVKALQPIARDLGPTVTDLSAVTPALTSAFQVLTYVVNELAFNPEGDDEGFLHWLAWFAHNGASMMSTEDAHGAVWRGLGILSCSAVTAAPELSPLLQAIVDPVPGCGTGASG